jgi:hypothetical protein
VALRRDRSTVSGSGLALLAHVEGFEARELRDSAPYAEFGSGEPAASGSEASSVSGCGSSRVGLLSLEIAHEAVPRPVRDAQTVRDIVG